MARVFTNKNCLTIFIFLVFALISIIIFDNVYNTANLIIDEEFHLPQGLLYCNFDFSTWNPKITTLPGLYLITSLILGPLGLCSIYWLRLLNLMASLLNGILCYILLAVESPPVRNHWTRTLTSINVSLIPPLFFFGHIYYTDVLSLTFILLLMICFATDHHIVASLFGLFAIVMRQTNVVWVAMCFLRYLFNELIVPPVQRSRSPEHVVIKHKHLKAFYAKQIRNGGVFFTRSREFYSNVVAYAATLLSFLVFVYLNGGIVVGDKSAHPVSLHIPQLFYFSMFCLWFAWPYFCESTYNWMVFCLRHITLSWSILVGIGLIVHYNSLVHPYLLADNRHYTFYVWKTFHKMMWFPTLSGVAYYCACYSLWQQIYSNHNWLFAFVYVPCAIFVLILPQMIEIRYFLIPFVLLRLRFRNVALWQLLAEFATFALLNALMFYIFFTKDIMWPDYDYPQKLIW